MRDCTQAVLPVLPVLPVLRAARPSRPDNVVPARGFPCASLGLPLCQPGAFPVPASLLGAVTQAQYVM